ncbi:hypothetical protein MNB_SM-3-475 [hydrothermal vent metagenome]|uniref:DUF234 domain-containing protein n=1 Tax=hydrothermal vent metagenome TaxID=652676 RepID=A0A1W1D1Z2_9ZZZZ
MAKNRLIQQFKKFYITNYPNDMETQIEYFSVFGGLDISVDTSKPLIQLVDEIILQNFETFEKKIANIINHDYINTRLLHALAVGDRRIFSAFKRAGLNNGNGGSALNYLVQEGILTLEYSRETPPEKTNQKLKRSIARHRISHKVLFTQPFIRFWFYFVVRYIKEIRKKEYTNFLNNFKQKKHSYTSLIFEELSELLLNYHLRDVQIVSSGSYWDANIEIDILTITNKDEIYIAECKWTNHIINKKELHKLKEKCERLKIQPKQIIFFSKRGFSKELMQMQSKDLALYSAKDFSILVKKTF